MAARPATTRAAAARPAVHLPLHRLDLATYNKTVACGALEGQPVELLDGLIVEMSPQSPDHAAVLEALVSHFSDANVRLRVQSPLEVPPDSEPEPDLAVLAQSPPPGHHPRTALLVIEVAVNSHTVDRGVKAKLYARAGIPVYWLVDVPGRAVEAHTNPTSDGYRRRRAYRQAADAHVPCSLEGIAALRLVALFERVKSGVSRSSES